MKELIENLYPMNASLLGADYDNRLEYLRHLLLIDVIEIPSGTVVNGWTIPDEWILRDAWVKYEGKKIIDYHLQPLSVVIGSNPIHGVVKLEELLQHLDYSDDRPDAVPYEFKFYKKDWGFCAPKNQVREMLTVPEQVGDEFITSKNSLPEGDYEVYINSEYVPGKMRIGVHTIKGKSDREILLFAHLDHPYQANDNLSAVACLTDLATKIHSKHTIKIIFCPETIGSIAYASTQNISKVDFVIAVDICGNTNNLLLQKSFDPEDRINRIAHLALNCMGETHRKGDFRSLLGSDEYFFNDPSVKIPGILLSRFPYPEYHSSDDTPDKIDYEAIEKTGKTIQKIIEIYDNDFIPRRETKGPLQRSKYDIQVFPDNKAFHLSWDYFWYSIDGKRSLAELACAYGLNWDYVYEKLLLMEKEHEISRAHSGKKPVKPSSRKKHKRL